MKIAVAGLLPVQNRQLAKRFEHRADILRFISNDSGPNMWESAAANMDKVIVATKFISHSHQDVLPRDKVIFNNGALSSISRELDELLPKSHRETMTKLRDDLPEETPMAQTGRTKKTGHAQKVYSYLASLTPTQLISVKDLIDHFDWKCTEPEGTSCYGLLTKLAKFGYLTKVERTKYRINEHTKKLATLEHTASGAVKLPPVDQGTAAPSSELTALLADAKGPVAQLKRYIDSMRTLAGNVEGLLPKLMNGHGKKNGDGRKKLDLSTVPTAKLMDEIINRRLEKRTRPKARA